jgi:hypothetical protein
VKTGLAGRIVCSTFNIGAVCAALKYEGWYLGGYVGFAEAISIKLQAAATGPLESA